MCVGRVSDLAIALAVIAANGKLPIESLHGSVLLGELGLDGQLRRVRGVLPLALAAASAGWSQLVVPEQNAAEAALVQDVSVLAVRSLRQLVAYLRGESGDEDPPARYIGGSAPPIPATPPGEHLDLSDVLGQAEARMAVEVAAAGGHHIFLTGPPGAGKTMLAERLPGLLPDLELAESLEVSAIHEVAGLLPEGEPLLRRPPFIDPHHTATVAAIIGGGSRIARPGSISLAHTNLRQYDLTALGDLRLPRRSDPGCVAVSGASVNGRACSITSDAKRR